MLLDSNSFPRDKVKSQTKLRTFKQLLTANVVILWTWNHCQVRLKWKRWWKSVYCMYIIWWYKLVFVSQYPQVKASFFSFAESVYSSLKMYVSKSDSVKQMWTHCYEKIELFRIWRCGICYRYTLHSCPAVIDNVSNLYKRFRAKPYKVFHSFIMKGVGSTLRK